MIKDGVDIVMSLFWRKRWLIYVEVGQVGIF